MLLVLDARDRADLDRITAKLLAAQAAGQLAEPEDEGAEPIEDAEIVEPGPSDDGPPREN